jgi:ankyrin repeat protein
MPTTIPQNETNAALRDFVQTDNTEGIRVAIENGADINARFDHEGANQTALQIAVRWKKTNALKELLKVSNLDVNAQDNYGSTSLVSATRLHLPEYVEMLLQHPDIKTDIKDAKGKSPWEIARQDLNPA